MANKRMISILVVDDDAFLELSTGAQLLYFHLCVRADDDGFLTPKKTMRAICAKSKSLEELIAYGYIYKFISGVVCIKHWCVHNNVRNDCYHTSVYPERNLVYINDRKEYQLAEQGEHDTTEPRQRIDATSSSSTYFENATKPAHERNGTVTRAGHEISKGKEREGTTPIGVGVNAQTLNGIKSPRQRDTNEQNAPALDDVRSYFNENNLSGSSEKFYEYYQSTGWKDKYGRLISDWKARARLWSKDESPSFKKTDNKEKPRDYDGSYDAYNLEEVVLE